MRQSIKLDGEDIIDGLTKVHQGTPFLVVLGILLYTQNFSYEDLFFRACWNRKVYERMNQVGAKRNTADFFSVLTPKQKRQVQDQEEYLQVLYGA